MALWDKGAYEYQGGGAGSSTWDKGAYEYGSSQGGGPATITYDTSASTSNANASQLILSHTVGSGTNTILILGACADQGGGAATVSNANFNGDPLTKITSDEVAGDTRAELWYLKSPDAGTHALTVNFSLNASVGICAIVLNNVNQVGFPYRDSDATHGNTSPMSLTLTTVALDWNVDFGYLFNAAANPTVGAGQTERINTDVGGSERMFMSTEEASGTSTVASYTFSGTHSYAYVAASFIPTNLLITPPAITGTSVNPPSILTTYALSLPTISSGVVLHAPILAYAITTPFKSSSSTLAAPSLAYEVQPPIISDTVLYSPAIINEGNLGGATIPSGAVLYAPALDYTIFPPAVASTTTLYPPAIAGNLIGAFLSSGSALNAPTLAYELDPPVIGSTTTLYTPTVTTFGALAVDPPTIPSTALLYPPSVANATSTARAFQFIIF